MTSILIVDDDPDGLYLLRTLLEANDYIVQSACNGKDAIDQISESIPDLIISDIMMPVMDGFAFCHACKRSDRFKSIPFVIYSSTYTDVEDEELAYKAGANKFIRKPIEPDLLIQSINQIIENIDNVESDLLDYSLEEHEKAYQKLYDERLVKKLEKKNEELKQEIANHKKTVLALKESEEKYRKLFEAAKDAILILQNEQIIICNPYTLDMFGYSGSRLDIHSLFELSPPQQENGKDSQAEQERIFHDVLLGKPQVYPWIFKRFDGSNIHCEVSLDKFQLDDSVFLLAIVRDISDRILLEAERLQTQKSRSLMQMAGGIAHDFRNLMSGITTSISVALKRVSSQPEIADFLRQALSAVGQGNELISMLQTYSKQEEINLREVELYSLITFSSKFILGDSNYSYVVNLPSDLWKINADKSQINQVVNNLIINGREAIENDGEIVIKGRNITLEDSNLFKLEKGNYVELQFRDNGKGISPEVIPRIFDPYFSTKTSGHGLGLATVHSIIKRHNGYIDVSSTENEGTEFRVILPASS